MTAPPVPADLVAVADAVKDALNAAALSPPFTAERAYAPYRDLTASAGLKVTVIPAGYTSTPLDLARRRASDCRVEVWVQQKVLLTNEAIDPLVALAQDVLELLGAARLPGYGAARNVAAANDPAPDRGDLVDLRLFSSTIALTFRVTR